MFLAKYIFLKTHFLLLFIANHIKSLKPLWSACGSVITDHAVQTNSSNPQRFVLNFSGRFKLSEDTKYVRIDFRGMFLKRMQIYNISISAQIEVVIKCYCILFFQCWISTTKHQMLLQLTIVFYYRLICRSFSKSINSLFGP